MCVCVCVCVFVCVCVSVLYSCIKGVLHKLMAKETLMCVSNLVSNLDKVLLCVEFAIWGGYD